MASLRSKIETALVAALDGVTNNIYKGISTEDKAGPCVIVRAVSAEDVVPYAGRYLATCEVIVKAHDETEFDTICEAVAVKTDTSDFVTNMTTSDLYVYGFAESSIVEWGTDGDQLTETRRIQIECALR